MIRSGLINMIREKAQKGKSAYAMGMEKGIFNCVVILERLQSMGYGGGITIIKDYVDPFGPVKSAPSVRRYELCLVSRHRWTGVLPPTSMRKVMCIKIRLS